MNKEERTDKEVAEGKFKEFGSIQGLVSDLKEPGVAWLCNNPSCSTRLYGCLWRKTTVYGI